MTVLTDARTYDIWDELGNSPYIDSAQRLRYARAIEAAVLEALGQAEPLTTVFVVGNKTSSMFFATRQMADAFASSFSSAVGLSVSEILVNGPPAQPDRDSNE